MDRLETGVGAVTTQRFLCSVLYVFPQNLYLGGLSASRFVGSVRSVRTDMMSVPAAIGRPFKTSNTVVDYSRSDFKFFSDDPAEIETVRRIVYDTSMEIKLNNHACGSRQAVCFISTLCDWPERGRVCIFCSRFAGKMLMGAQLGFFRILLCCGNPSFGGSIYDNIVVA
jgi:hypothetical protein